jgi:choline-sulfatase
VHDAGYATSVFGKLHLHPHVGDLRDRLDVIHAYGLEHVDEIAGPRASARCRSNLTDRWEEAGVYEAYKRDLRERDAHKAWVARPSPLPLELYADTYVGTQAAAWLRGYHGPRPWFCWVSFGGPHEPWDAPEPYASRYDPAAMPAPAERWADGRPRPRGLLDERRRVRFEPGDVARMRANYAGNVTLIDDQVGAVLGVVEERGELDRTVVAFVSDHGEMNGDYDLIYKENFLAPAARIPLIVRPPASRAGAAGVVCEAPVEFMDLGATLAELAGAAPVEDSLARSLVPLLADPERSHRDMALCEYRREAMGITREWRIALNEAREPYLLFDARADPAESRNLAGLPEYADAERGLAQQLEQTIAAAA